LEKALRCRLHALERTHVESMMSTGVWSEGWLLVVHKAAVREQEGVGGSWFLLKWSMPKIALLLTVEESGGS
jgi:hypothetical protein